MKGLDSSPQGGNSLQEDNGDVPLDGIARIYVTGLTIMGWQFNRSTRMGSHIF